MPVVSSDSILIGDRNAETWPAYLSPEARFEAMLAALRLEVARCGLRLRPLISVTATPNPLHQFLIGDDTRSCKIAINQHNQVGIIFFLEDDRSADYEYRPTHYKSVTLGHFIKHMLAVLELDRCRNTRLRSSCS